ncbi:hypothetical protein NP493_860g00021 [Ridgeia piscesae]|uniref:Uncharacterized protein n=1 Tax=Ridgeia piscesae TaxID=27915 RepID=A0AAD9KM37_RIDPI|nr:hypothetical protein NP493_860g00021 [Ridgeia piscesae]
MKRRKTSRDDSNFIGLHLLSVETPSSEHFSCARVHLKEVCVVLCRRNRKLEPVVQSRVCISRRNASDGCVNRRVFLHRESVTRFCKHWFLIIGIENFNKDPGCHVELSLVPV